MIHRINDMKTSVHCLVLAALVTILVGGCDSASTEESWFEGGDEPPPTEQTLVMTARILAAKGDYGQAGFIVERMLLEFPDRPGTYTEGAEVLLQEGRVSDAIEFLDLGLERLPGHPVLLNDRGLCQLLNGDLPAASSDFSAALAVDPDDADYVANSALAADSKTEPVLRTQGFLSYDIGARVRDGRDHDGTKSASQEVSPHSDVCRERGEATPPNGHHRPPARAALRRTD